MFSFLRRQPKLSQQEEADEILKFAHFKQRIVATSAYDESSDYELLYSKIREMLRDLLGRHRGTLIPSEGEQALLAAPGNFLQLESGVWRIRRALNIEDCDSSALMALALYSHLGGEQIAGKKVAQNRFFTNRVVEYLIVGLSYPPALLAKALILMYGFQEYLPPQTEEARVAFQRYGYSNPDIQDEISSLPNLARLVTLKPKGGVHASQTWRTHEDIEAMLKDYHPDNRNG